MEDLKTRHQCSSPVYLMPVIESALGVLNALEVVKHSPYPSLTSRSSMQQGIGCAYRLVVFRGADPTVQARLRIENSSTVSVLNCKEHALFSF